MIACKRFSNVGVQLPNKMIYGDSGRYLMFIASAVRCVRYWLRITNISDDRSPKEAYITCCCICTNFFFFFFRVRPMRNSEEIHRDWRSYTGQRLLLFHTLYQFMTKCLFVNCPLFLYRYLQRKNEIVTSQSST